MNLDWETIWSVVAGLLIFNTTTGVLGYFVDKQLDKEEKKNKEKYESLNADIFREKMERKIKESENEGKTHNF